MTLLINNTVNIINSKLEQIDDNINLNNIEIQIN